MRRLLVVAALIAAGCSSPTEPSGFGVNLTVRAGTTSSETLAQTSAAQLTVNGDEPDPFTHALDILAQLKAGDVRFRYVPHAQTGTLTLTVALLGGDDQVLASGSSGPVTLQPDHSVAAVITLGPPPPDLGVPSSSDGGIDLGGDDAGEQGSVDLAPSLDLAKLPQGAACNSSDECGSPGGCVDGVCCDSPCEGQCQACDVTPGGKCEQVPSGQPHGTRPACAGKGSTCGGSCGTHPTTCDYPDSTISCRAQSCSGSTKTLAATCDGKGACPMQTETCGAFQCSGADCLTACTANTQCVSPAVCISGKCQGQLADGAKCTGNGDCLHGFCVDGYCCNSACNGACQACDVSGSLGVCSFVSGSPHGSRACNGTGMCAGSCSGSSASCSYPPSSTVCSAQKCTGSTQTLAATCDGLGSCNAPGTHSCGAYVCSGTSCLTSCTVDADCSSGYCNGSTCLSTKPNGHTCAANSECTNGFCVDGYCCNSVCNGQCQACDQTPGTCLTIVGAPHSNAVTTRAACTSDSKHAVCNGTCGGSNPSACTYPTVNCSYCGPENQKKGAPLGAHTAACNSGTCIDSSFANCGLYICNASTVACYTSCSGDSQCVSNTVVLGTTKPVSCVNSVCTVSP